MRLFKSNNKKEHDNRVHLILCYHANSFSAKDVVSLVKQDSFGFKPAFIETDDEPVEFGEQHLEEMEAMTQDESDLLMGVGVGVNLTDDKNEQSFHLVQLGRKNWPQVIYWTVKDLSVLDSELFKSLISHKAFTAGYCGDKVDMSLQSEKNISIYKSKGLKPQYTTTNEYGDQIVDVSKNPGRMKSVQYFWLMSCWRMWFGKKYLEYVPKDHLMSFEGAEINELGNVVEVKLYDDPFDAANKKNRKIQERFRDHLQLDRLEKELS